MTELDRLPPDQRAVLSLVLDRGKSYGEVAEMLAIPESAVRDRAHAALDALAREAATPGAREAATPGSSRAAPKPTAARAPTGAERPSRRGPGEPALRGPGPVSSGRPSPRPRNTRAPMSSPSSRRAGALLLGGIVAVIVVAVILISGGGGGKGSSASTVRTSSTPATTTSSAGASKPKLNKTIALTPPEPSDKASGQAYVLSENGRYAFYISAQGLPPSSGFFYAVWLYNSPSSAAPLGRAPNVGADGRMLGGNPLPTNASFYHQLIVTRETSTHPSHPGEIVLRGTFGLH